MAEPQAILFVDAYDSFSQNITAVLHQQLSAEVTTIHIDTDVVQTYNCELETFIKQFAAIVLGPGPGDPRCGTKDTGLFSQIFRFAAIHHVPVLGICLGFQTLCLQNGLSVSNLPQPCHGHAKRILPVKDHPIFEAIDNHEIWATCYNSLGVHRGSLSVDVAISRPGSASTDASFGSSISRPEDSLEESSLDILAVDHDGYIMAIAHKSRPFIGFQFHPESCRSNSACLQLLSNWFQLVTDSNKRLRPDQLATPTDLPFGPRQRMCPGYNAAWTTCSQHDRPRVRQNQGISSQTQILQALLKATMTSGPIVASGKRQTKLKRKQLSQFVQTMSTGHNVAILESTKKGRYSIYALLGGAAATGEGLGGRNENVTQPLISYRNGVFRLKYHCPVNRTPKIIEIETERAQLIAAIEEFLILKQARDGLSEVPFWGGFMGFMSYELGLDTIDVKVCNNTERKIDDLSFLWVERSMVYDSETSTVYVQSICKNDEEFVMTMIDVLEHEEKASDVKCPEAEIIQLHHTLAHAKFQLPDRQEYDSAYDRCQKHLRAGDSYELCLTTQASISLPHLSQVDVFQLYANMHAHNPVPYGAIFDFPNLTILSTSPEQFMSWTRAGQIDMMPMKGTVKRTPSMTLARATEILSTPKESAENLMIADLIRHDLYSAVGYTSKVEVMKLCEVVEHETVYQLVSHIRAHVPIISLLPDPSKREAAMRYGLEALTTSLPPGSMTGAPKKRSCEILGDLERRHRGVYSGVIGYLDIGGGGAWNVAIRTAFRVKDQGKGNDWHIGAGGAITVLSDKQGEWEEMQTKLNSVLKGFTVVSDDL